MWPVRPPPILVERSPPVSCHRAAADSGRSSATSGVFPAPSQNGLSASCRAAAADRSGQELHARHREHHRHQQPQPAHGELKRSELRPHQAPEGGRRHHPRIDRRKAPAAGQPAAEARGRVHQDEHDRHGRHLPRGRHAEREQERRKEHAAPHAGQTRGESEARAHGREQRRPEPPPGCGILVVRAVTGRLSTTQLTHDPRGRAGQRHAERSLEHGGRQRVGSADRRGRHARHGQWQE